MSAWTDLEAIAELTPLIGQMTARNLREPAILAELLGKLATVMEMRDQPATAAIIEAAVRLAEAVIEDLTA